MGFTSWLRPDPSTGQPEIIRSGSVGRDEKTGTAMGGTTFIDASHTKEVTSVPSEDGDNEDEAVHKDMQPGVQKVEAIAQVWPKWALYLTYGL